MRQRRWRGGDSAGGARASVGRVRARRESLRAQCVLLRPPRQPGWGPHLLLPRHLSSAWAREDRRPTFMWSNLLPGPPAQLPVSAVREQSSTGGCTIIYNGCVRQFTNFLRFFDLPVYRNKKTFVVFYINKCDCSL